MLMQLGGTIGFRVQISPVRCRLTVCSAVSVLGNDRLCVAGTPAKTVQSGWPVHFHLFQDTRAGNESQGRLHAVYAFLHAAIGDSNTLRVRRMP